MKKSRIACATRLFLLLCEAALGVLLGLALEGGEDERGERRTYERRHDEYPHLGERTRVALREHGERGAEQPDTLPMTNAIAMMDRPKANAMPSVPSASAPYFLIAVAST